MRRLPPPYLSGLILLLLTAVATAVSFQKEAVWIQSRFDQSAKLRQQAIFKAFNDKLLVLESMQSVFQAINAVPRPEFGNMANPFQNSQPGIDGYRWIAAIPGANSSLQEFAKGINGFYPTFRAWERSASGELIPPQQRPMHYLVMPLPDGTTDTYSGFDLASRPVTATAIAKALESGGVQLSAQFDMIIVPDQSNRRVIAFAPVFSTTAQGKGELLGLIAGMFNLSVVIQSALDQVEPASIRLQVSDLGGIAPAVLYQSAAVPDETGLGIYLPLQPDPHMARMSIGGRPWTVRVEPESSFVAELGISSTLVVLLCGLAVSLILPAYLAFYTRKEARLAESQARLREAQLQLLHSQKLEIIGEMTSGIAHDFNNVLQGVLAQADLAAAYTASRDQAQLNTALESIIQAASMGAGLVSKLSGFSVRAKRGASATNLQEVLQGTSVLLKPVLGATIQLQINAGSPCWSAVDKTDFEQVVLNLCINARDAIRTHARQGSSIAITLGERTLNDAVCSSCGTPFSGRFVVLAVKDNGGGIPAQTMKRMFDPFFTTKPEGKGTGLGLSIVHSVVHHAAGHLCVESSEGEGTTFTICLPESSTHS